MLSYALNSESVFKISFETHSGEKIFLLQFCKTATPTSAPLAQCVVYQRPLLLNVYNMLNVYTEWT